MDDGPYIRPGGKNVAVKPPFAGGAQAGRLVPRRLLAAKSIATIISGVIAL